MSPPKPLNIVLASTSPQRREILNLLKIPFEIASPTFEEKSRADLSPESETILFAEEKAKSIESLFPNHLIIGSDTLIGLEEKKIGKPKNIQEAEEILKLLRGKWHQILTAVSIISPVVIPAEAEIPHVHSGDPHLRGNDRSTWTHLEIVKIKMKNYSDEEIKNYILKDEPYDKAGSYALQGRGRSLIEKLEGDYLAAVGLPLRVIAQQLKLEEFEFSVDIEKIYEEKNFMNWKEY